MRFDILRVIGLLAIILAHTNVPGWLFQLRNFDVPLMMLVSGAVYGLSSATSKPYLSYIWGRIIRLLLPTWVFLSLFFIFSWISGKQFTPNTILQSFALLDGIGYVWIIRVFILVACITPLFVYFYQSISLKRWYLLVLVGIFFLYTLLRYVYLVTYVLHTTQLTKIIFENVVFYLLAYGTVAGLGVYVLSASKKAILLHFGFFSILFISLVFLYSNHGFIPTQMDKYPPGIYYLSYALGVSLLLYFFSYTKVFRFLENGFVRFVAESSLWIYLWQIFFLYQWGTRKTYLPATFQNFLVEYCIIVVLSVAVTYFQKKIVGFMVSKLQNPTLQTLLSISFLK